MYELPRITKRELARVGIDMPFENSVREWMHRGWCEMEMYLWGNQQLRGWLDKDSYEDKVKRVFEEDGA